MDRFLRFSRKLISDLAFCLQIFIQSHQILMRLIVCQDLANFDPVRPDWVMLSQIRYPLANLHHHGDLRGYFPPLYVACDLFSFHLSSWERLSSHLSFSIEQDPLWYLHQRRRIFQLGQNWIWAFRWLHRSIWCFHHRYICWRRRNGDRSRRRRRHSHRSGPCHLSSLRCICSNNRLSHSYLSSRRISWISLVCSALSSLGLSWASIASNFSVWLWYLSLLLSPRPIPMFLGSLPRRYLSDPHPVSTSSCSSEDTSLAWRQGLQVCLQTEGKDSWLLIV